MLISELEKKINYKFINENILKEALIHSSYVSKKNELMLEIKVMKD